MKLALYNTLTRSKDIFESLEEGTVKLYSCGPTVYGDPHIGNMRAYVFVDLLKSTLIHVGGYEVMHAMNITDVGHLTDDGDQGEDKMEKGARRENKTVREVARMYERNFKEYSNKLHIESPNVYTRATEYMKEQIDMIHTLIEKDFTYVIEDDGIYMDTSKIDDYGKLAQLDFDGMNSEHRVDGAKIDSSKKKNLSDFALWKFSPTDEKRSMQRIFSGDRSGALLVSDSFDQDSFVQESDYGKPLQTASLASVSNEERSTIGFPGWHIECSAMATKELGHHIDIHTGGVDHVPVHHTNEIAQAECSLGCSQRVRRWMHGQFLQIDGSKVSKSKGDDLSIPGIMAKGYDPLDLRFFYFTGHYRSFLDFTWEALDAAKKTRQNIIKKIATYLKSGAVEEPGPFFDTLAEYLADDLHIVGVMTCINEAMSSLDGQIIGSILDFDDVILKLGLRKAVEEVLAHAQKKAPEKIIELAEARLQAKNDKDYALADDIRKQITVGGRRVIDVSGGYELEKL